MSDQEQFKKEIAVKRADIVIKVVGAVFIGAGLLVSAYYNHQVLQRQQAHFEATERKEWTRRLFDEQFAIYNGIATAAFQMKASKSQREAADALASLREWQAKASLLANSRVLSEIHSACESAERFIESGKRDDRQTEEGKRSPDLTPSCARLITECRIAVLHSGILKLAEHDEAENAVSTAFAEIVNGRNIGLSEPPPADIPSPQ